MNSQKSLDSVFREQADRIYRVTARSYDKMLNQTSPVASANAEEDIDYKRFLNTNGRRPLALGHGGPVIMSDHVRQVVA